jgi:hypothetical protein
VYAQAVAKVNNALIQLIVDGRIRTLEDLRSTYHKLAMQTHPDSVGSDKLLRKFLEFSDQYEEAKTYLAQSIQDHGLSSEASNTNYRLEFYKQLHLIESLEMPYAFHLDENQESISVAKQMAISALSQWKPAVVDLYVKADSDHLSIKREKPRGPYLKHALALNIRPIMHNIVAFQLTGQEVYARQSQQNLNAIMQKLADQGWNALHGLLTFMIEDLKNGAAVLE